MKIEDDLFSALKTLVGNRVSPVIFPQPPAIPVWPAIRYTIETTPIQDICGDGDDSTADMRVQLDVVAERYPAVRTLRLQVMAAMAAFDPPAMLEFSTPDYDDTTKTFREILQYVLYPSTDMGSP